MSILFNMTPTKSASQFYECKILSGRSEKKFKNNRLLMFLVEYN